MNVLKSYQQTPQNCSGSHDDKLQTKFALFCERCNEATLPQQSLHLAISVMLAGPALNFILTIVKKNCETVRDMLSRFRERIVTQETILALTLEWESMDLIEFQKKTPKCYWLNSFNNIFARRQGLQLCLPRLYHSDEQLKTGLSMLLWVSMLVVLHVEMYHQC